MVQSELERFQQGRLDQMVAAQKAQEMRMILSKQFQASNQASYLPNASTEYESFVIGSTAVDVTAPVTNLSIIDPNSAVPLTDQQERDLFINNLSQLIGSTRAQDVQLMMSIDAIGGSNDSWAILKTALQTHFKRVQVTTKMVFGYIVSWLASTYGVAPTTIVQTGAPVPPLVPVTPPGGTVPPLAPMTAPPSPIAAPPIPPMVPTTPGPPAVTPAPTPPVNAAPAPTPPVAAPPSTSTTTTPLKGPQTTPSSTPGKKWPAKDPAAVYDLGQNPKYGTLHITYTNTAESEIQKGLKPNPTVLAALFDMLSSLGVNITEDYTLIIIEGVHVIDTFTNPFVKGVATVLVNSYMLLNQHAPYSTFLSAKSLSLVGTKIPQLKKKTTIPDTLAVLSDLCKYEQNLRSTNYKDLDLTVGRGFKGPLVNKQYSHGPYRIQSGSTVAVKKNPNNIRLVLGGGTIRRDVVQQMTDKIVEKATKKEAWRWYVPDRPTLYLDLQALNANRVSLKYATSNLYKLTAPISDAGRILVQGIILRDVFDARLFAGLKVEERRVIETLLQYVRKSNIDGYDGPETLAQMTQNLTIYQGQLEAGNKDPRIKDALRDVVREMVKLKHMTVAHSKSILSQI